VQYVARADLPTGQPQPFGAGTPVEVQNAVPKVTTGKVETETLPAVPGTREAAQKPVHELPKAAQTPVMGSADAGSLPTGQVVRVPGAGGDASLCPARSFSNYAMRRGWRRGWDLT